MAATFKVFRDRATGVCEAAAKNVVAGAEVVFDSGIERLHGLGVCERWIRDHCDAGRRLRAPPAAGGGGEVTESNESRRDP
ncbi:MAG: hypothetical protein HY719_05640 [Planctomycetes bacterium]|nr:hypothetical protein [Planctomycetota bacterium]